LHWFIAGKKAWHQNVLLLFASYYFYACWNWHFLFLLLFSTTLDYFSAIKIEGETSPGLRKLWLWISISINLGFLAVFKYYNFFAVSFQEAAQALGVTVHPAILNIILPVGISFYTFHGLSYIIDCYYNRIKAERNFVDYAVFVSFFPLLVAGPIERATHLLPQLKTKRTFNYSNVVNGLKQILWGLFKKVVIADNCAEFVNLIFDNSAVQPGSTLIMGAVFFAFQIYGDFSGYSDIAIGTARLFGIELIRNFAFPYFSRDIAEFWRRWHISLSTWFRDYVYIPLGGSRMGTYISVRNTFIIFIISGFWHGANWTFICWGLLHAVYFLPLLLTNKNRDNISIVAQNNALPSIKELAQMLFTFALVSLAWIFFRANTVGHAFNYISGIFSRSVFTMPFFEQKKSLFATIALVLVFIVLEWMGRRQHYAIEIMGNTKKRVFRIALYYALVIAIFLFWGKGQQFIYFQF
jgi:D-alanyl-lipoteichoic acid acyltransferase DltB (MBOAT superfamily)